MKWFSNIRPNQVIELDMPFGKESLIMADFSRRKLKRESRNRKAKELRFSRNLIKSRLRGAYFGIRMVI